MDAFDLIVVGGGLVGAALAWGARTAGANVVLLDEGDQAHRAARGNFGLVWLQGKGVGTPAYMQWSLRAGRMWPGFAERLSHAVSFDIGWRQPGGLQFCFSEAELDKRRDVIARTKADGGDIDISILQRADLRALLPGIGEDVVGASFSQLDGHVNPLHLLRALQQAFQDAGGRYEPGFRVEHIANEKHGFTAVGHSGSVAGGRIVLAAGLGAAGLAKQVGLSMPVKPERGQIVVTERIKPFLPYATTASGNRSRARSCLAAATKTVVSTTARTCLPRQRCAGRPRASFPRWPRPRWCAVGVRCAS
jgi:glycine/D-amino acid oxidase-like deaminating enzyme